MSEEEIPLKRDSIQIDGEETVVVVDNKLKQNTFQACLSLIKAVVGAGSFALPWGFRMAGLWGGVIGLTVLGILCYYTIMIMIRCKNDLDWSKHGHVTYVKLARRILGKWFGYMLYFSIVVSSLGACSAYLVFNGQTLVGITGVLNYRIWVLIIASPLILLTWMRSFRHLAFASIIGDVALTLGFITVMVVGFSKQGITFDLPAFKWKTFPLFFGTGVFLFAIHMLVFPIEQSLHKQSRFHISLKVCFVIVTTANVLFSALGYMFFGEKTLSPIIENLGNPNWVTFQGILVNITKIALVADLFFTYLVVFVAARDIIEDTLRTNFLRDDAPMIVWRVNLVRTLMVSVTIAAGLIVTQFGDLVTLVSGLGMTFMAFILPQLLFLKLYWNDAKGNTSLRIELFIQFIILVIGIAAAITTTFESVQSIIKDFS